MTETNPDALTRKTSIMKIFRNENFTYERLRVLIKWSGHSLDIYVLFMSILAGSLITLIMRSAVAMRVKLGSRVASSRLAAGEVTLLCPWARHFINCLILDQQSPYIDWKIVDWGVNVVKHQNKQNLSKWRLILLVGSWTNSETIKGKWLQKTSHRSQTKVHSQSST